jgi:hypothetical protein
MGMARKEYWELASGDPAADSDQIEILRSGENDEERKITLTQLKDYMQSGAQASVVCEGVLFTEDGSATSYTGTVEIPAGAVLQNIQIVTTVLWDGTSASLDVGDDDDPNGWFDTINVKATDLLVGEVLDITQAENWGGSQGAYLVAATGRKGRTTAGVDSGVFYGAASEVVGVITPGAADGSAGRTYMFVTYAVPTVVDSTNV